MSKYICIKKPKVDSIKIGEVYSFKEYPDRDSYSTQCTILSMWVGLSFNREELLTYFKPKFVYGK